MAAGGGRHRGGLGAVVGTDEEDPVLLGQLAHAGVDGLVVGGGQDVPRALEVALDERALVPHDLARAHESLDRGRGLRRHDLDPRAPGEQTGWEFYSYRDAPWERRNAYADPEDAAEVAALTERLEAFDACRAVTRGQPWPDRCRDLTGPR